MQRNNQSLFPAYNDNRPSPRNFNESYDHNRGHRQHHGRRGLSESRRHDDVYSNRSNGHRDPSPPIYQNPPSFNDVAGGFNITRESFQRALEARNEDERRQRDRRRTEALIQQEQEHTREGNKQVTLCSDYSDDDGVPSAVTIYPYPMSIS